MTDRIEFTKLSGSGNDFICINNMDGRYDRLLASPGAGGHFARTLCRRGLGIGADGVIFASPPEIEEKADFSAKFFETDGSEAELCGNGTACFVRWVIDSRLIQAREIRILTPAGVVLGNDVRDNSGAASGEPNGSAVSDNYYRVCIPFPYDIQTDVSITVHGQPVRCDFAVVGVPHAVVYVDDVNEVDMQSLGKGIRFHERFAPRGVNANFVQVLGEGQLRVRTWEFGVEGETLACGTGSAAAAVLAARRFGWPRRLTTNQDPVFVQATSGDRLRVFVGIDEAGQFTDLCLDTVVRPVFSGALSDLLAAEALSATRL
jgi:diaminopimelate epimerase